MGRFAICIQKLFLELLLVVVALYYPHNTFANNSRYVEGFLPNFSGSLNFGRFNSPNSSSVLSSFGYGLSAGATWYFERILLEASTGFNYDGLTGTENNKNTSFVIGSYALNTGLKYRFGFQRSWHLGAIYRIQLGDGNLQFSNSATQPVGQVFWFGPSVSYDLTSWTSSYHLQASTTLLSSLNIPSQRGFILQVGLGILISGNKKETTSSERRPSSLPSNTNNYSSRSYQQRNSNIDLNEYWNSQAWLHQRGSEPNYFNWKTEHNAYEAKAKIHKRASVPPQNKKIVMKSKQPTRSYASTPVQNNPDQHQTISKRQRILQLIKMKNSLKRSKESQN